MGLTSNKMLVVVVVLALALFVGTVWHWPRLSRRNWRAVGGRVGLLFATQLMVFASIGLAANQAFGFYATWTDLFGRERGRVWSSTTGRRERAAVRSRWSAHSR